MEEAKMELIKFSSQDVIATSGHTSASVLSGFSEKSYYTLYDEGEGWFEVSDAPGDARYFENGEDCTFTPDGVAMNPGLEGNEPYWVHISGPNPDYPYYIDKVQICDNPSHHFN